MNRLTFAVVLYAVLMFSVASIGPWTAVHAAFPGTNGKIAFSHAEGWLVDFEIYTMNADGSDQTRLASGNSDEQPAWSPDGSKIAFTREWGTESADIYVMNADGSDQTRLTSTADRESFPAWSPDGTKIAFARAHEGRGQIYIMNADGSGQTQLTSTQLDESHPAWSPDGSKIAFDGAPTNKSPDIYVMNADGSGQTRLTSNHSPYGPASQPAWSPDGSRIAFTKGWGSKSPYIYVMNADGFGQTQITTTAVSIMGAVWSSDGTKIAFAGGTGPEETFEYDIYVINSDGSDQTRLTFGLADVWPDWQRAVVTQTTTARQTSTSTSFYATSSAPVQSVSETTILQTPYAVLTPRSSLPSIFLGVILGLVVSMPISVYRHRKLVR